jgi:acyl-CoA hydrolase
VGVEATLTAARCAKFVVAQVNDQMPRTFGDGFVHVKELDAVVEVSRPLCELRQIVVTEMHHAIGRNVATLIEDGATLQLGIGAIPDAVLLELANHRDLGVHSEMLSDRAVPLIESGVINGSRKTIHRGKVVVGFVLGTKRMFEFVNNNPIFEFHPSRYTNDPYVISQNYKMAAVNSGLQVDITGQVCADSIGTQFYSGIGGQVDFIRGASRCKGGKPIIALPATAKDGAISRIVPMLDPGAGVVTSRGAVHYVVTEFGVAYLHGRTIRQRAEALIEIAHPKFHEELYRYCEKTRWLQRPAFQEG